MRRDNNSWSERNSKSLSQEASKGHKENKRIDDVGDYYTKNDINEDNNIDSTKRRKKK